MAAVADAVLQKEPESTRERFGRILDLPWDMARPWILLLIALHDLGKACPGFQLKWAEFKDLLLEAGLRIPLFVEKRVHHAFVSQAALFHLLCEEAQWVEELAELAADAVGSHHGKRCGPVQLQRLEHNRNAMGDSGWAEVRTALFNRIFELFQPKEAPRKERLTGPDFMLLAGLTSFADWIGSSEKYFSYGSRDDCADLPGWWRRRRETAEQALADIGWLPRDPLLEEEQSFDQIFSRLESPRPLQKFVEEIVKNVDEPIVLLIEAPMGEGKTEAAFYSHLELQRRLGHRGFYIALPSMATGNAMFDRALKFLRSVRSDRNLDFQLLHGEAFLNESFQNLRFSCIDAPEADAAVRAGEWFTHKKRALLSEYGVGTVDQILLPILSVRHHFVRLWGLANRVVVFDEIHAYDTYTGTLIEHLIRWLFALGSSVILLSATLPPGFRRRISCITGGELREPEADYPRVTVFRQGKVEQNHVEADESRQLSVVLEGLHTDLASIQIALSDRLQPEGGMALALMNTVNRAQDLYRQFPDGEPIRRNGVHVGKRLQDGTEILLFHARFPANQRQVREKEVLDIFGKEGNRRSGRKILIATQVAEQSLDLDFDLIVSELAPIDLILQRVGRLWRHVRAKRPLDTPCLLIIGLFGEEPPSFERPLWWSKVYREDLLLRTWCLLKSCSKINLPDDIDRMVRMVYESKVSVPLFMLDRMQEAESRCTGEMFAHRTQANKAVIGLPDDWSWNDPGRYVLADEDEPGLHPSLIAHTRQGDRSVVAIPVFKREMFDLRLEPSGAEAKTLFARAIPVSRKGVVCKLEAVGIPQGWRKSPLLRNCYPLELDDQGLWEKDTRVRLNDDLGLVYGQ